MQMYYLTVSKGQKPRLTELDPLRGVTQYPNESVGRATFLTQAAREKSTPKLIHFVGSCRTKMPMSLLL